MGATLVVLAGCSDGGPGSTPSPSTPPETTENTQEASPSRTSGLAPSKDPDALYANFTTATGASASLLIEVASTPEERAKGLMGRASLPRDQGMLFDFEGETQAGFWMKDTLIPLSIAFVDNDGIIVHIEDMEPQTEQLHVSPTPYRYAIEANKGWFAENGIQVGDLVQIRPG